MHGACAQVRSRCPSRDRASVLSAKRNQPQSLPEVPSLKQAGYRVGTATSGLDALGQLEVEVPDILLVDTAIGEVDGFALYARLQQRPEWAHLPFIFLLDGEDATQKLRAVQLGVSDFLTKPVFLKEALSRVELLLEKQAQRGDGAVWCWGATDVTDPAEAL